jgi:rod shape-determining protein MreD
VVTAPTTVWVRVPLIILVALAVQTTLFTDVRPFGALADIMLLLALTAGMVAGPRDGALYGFVAGLAYDLMLRTPFGLSALTYALVGYGAGYLEEAAAAARWWMAMIVTAAASAVSVVVYALIGTVFGLRDVVTVHLLSVTAVVAVVNGLLAPVALPVQRWALRGRVRAAI